ncbi:hypothetical protein [uncultured Maribacter sp.]|uniref:hypothetical protein n=1 Tax=uncultured Maribacter sp. TaxID=431308 RepID=UPI00260B50ED|nr:hypothetical protein [uncultured Maribacter sp.]
MRSKQCSVCSGLGERNFVAGSSSTYEQCYACDGTGYIQVAEQIREETDGRTNGGKAIDLKGKKTTPPVSLRVIKIGWSVVVFVVTCFLSKGVTSNSIYVSLAIGLFAAFVMYKWYKILAPIIGFSLLAYGIYTIFG